jgi:hypothetical protein
MTNIKMNQASPIHTLPIAILTWIKHHYRKHYVCLVCRVSVENTRRSVRAISRKNALSEDSVPFRFRQCFCPSPSVFNTQPRSRLPYCIMSRRRTRVCPSVERYKRTTGDRKS